MPLRERKWIWPQLCSRLRLWCAALITAQVDYGFNDCSYMYSRMYVIIKAFHVSCRLWLNMDENCSRTTVKDLCWSLTRWVIQHRHANHKNAKPSLHACDLHAFSLHDVDIIFRASIITVQAQGSPEVGPQLAMTSDKGSNYFSVRKQEAEWRDGNPVRADKTQQHLTDGQPSNVLDL